jgi:lipopolysaccharide export LptBFGC system permease protein LptF
MMKTMSHRRSIGHVCGVLSLSLAFFIWIELLGFATWSEKYMNDFSFATIFFGSLFLAIAAGLLSSRWWLSVITIPLAA